MISKVFSSTFSGLNCHIVEVETDISNGLPQFNIVGLGDASVQESKERVRTSIKNCGLTFPQTRKTVNLAPAQLRKQGSLFDLPIAISLLISSNQIQADQFKDAVIVGELSLEGSVKEVNGILPITHHVAQKGFKKIFLPSNNAREAGFIDGIEIYPVAHLMELIRGNLQPFTSSKAINHVSSNNTDYLKIFGLSQAKRALTIAAAGHHSLLMTGSPGCGKTVLARAIRPLLSSMEKNEILDTTKIFSIAGLLDQDQPLIHSRPFREVHHTASRISIIGGGSNPRPGEVSLAHNGVLFLDEIAEFPHSVLESLRQPLEDKFIHINRANFSLKFPCDFMLIGTMNPCPCGYKGDKKTSCHCNKNQVKNYQNKISGPLLDRFDIFLNVEKTELKEMFNEGEEAIAIKDLERNQNLIRTASQIQNERKIKNSNMSLSEIRRFCRLDKKTSQLLNSANRRMNLSSRAYLRILKVARTIADLENSQIIKYDHLGEALQYRRA